MSRQRRTAALDRPCRFGRVPRMSAFGASSSLPPVLAKVASRTDSCRSALAAGTGFHAPYLPLAIPVGPAQLRGKRAFAATHRDDGSCAEKRPSRVAPEREVRPLRPYTSIRSDARRCTPSAPASAASSRISCCENLSSLARCVGYLLLDVCVFWRCVRSASLG